jgi:hypothetical protein
MKPAKKPSKEGQRAEKALQTAVADAIAEHRRMGIPIAVMKDGKAVYVSVNEKQQIVREPKKHYKAR